jgi:hypothetical protein
VCEWAGRPRRVVSGHEQATCNHEGGDMEGYSLGDCIEEQWRINDRHHKHKKRQYDEKEWDEESNDAEGRSQAKAARTGTESDVPGDAVDKTTHELGERITRVMRHATKRSSSDGTACAESRPTH